MGLRDPFVFRKQDGTFVVIATDLFGTDFGQTNQFLHVWDSVNLTSFTGYRRLRMHNIATTHTWAPTAFWDAARGQYGIVYSANNGQDVFLVNYTPDFRSSTPSTARSSGQDQLWRMVPGLADPAGVSFESVNVPGRYLRHFNFAIRLDPDDNTALFRAYATFYRVAGLADPAWSSFRSFNFPTHHLRHANFSLRIDPISGSSSVTDRQDATFLVTP